MKGDNRTVAVRFYKDFVKAASIAADRYPVGTKFCTKTWLLNSSILTLLSSKGSRWRRSVLVNQDDF